MRKSNSEDIFPHTGRQFIFLSSWLLSLGSTVPYCVVFFGTTTQSHGTYQSYIQNPFHFHDFHILTFRPTPLPESIKSLIVYIYEKSAGVCTCCSFRYSRLSHCPIQSERATQKPTPICLYIRPLSPCKTHMDTIGDYIKHTHRASTVALSSTGFRTCEILSSQRIKASSKRLLYICSPTLLPPPTRLPHGYARQIYGK